MAKRTKVSVDDFEFFDEEEAQLLNLIAKSIQKSEAIHEPKLSQSEVKALAEREQSVSNASPKPLVEYIKTESKQSLNGVEKDLTVSKRSSEQGLNSVTSESKQSLNGVEKD